jgi:hypothetical protein
MPPDFTGSSPGSMKGMPRKPVIMSILGKLKSAGILKTMHRGSTRRPQVNAFPVLVNLRERKKVI